jgi:hypothetical protein
LWRLIKKVFSPFDALEVIVLGAKFKTAINFICCMKSVEVAKWRAREKQKSQVMHKMLHTIFYD